MTDNVTNLPLTSISQAAVRIKAALGVLLGACLLSQPVNGAEQDWWFDVEVILFKRNVDAKSIAEKFEQSRLDYASVGYLDLLTPHLISDLSYLNAGLSYCSPKRRLAVKEQRERDLAFPMSAAVNQNSFLEELDKQIARSKNLRTTQDSFEYQVATSDVFSEASGEDTQLSADLVSLPVAVEFIEWQIPSEFPCSYAQKIESTSASFTSMPSDVLNQTQPYPLKRVPVTIDGPEISIKRDAFLLPSSTMTMGDLYQKIQRQRDISPILHLNWRQKVNFGRDNGQTIRLFAGQNFADRYDANGLPLIQDTDDLFASLSQVDDDFYLPEEELAMLSSQEKQKRLDRISGRSEAVPEDLFAKIDAALKDASPITIDSAPSQQVKQQSSTSQWAVLKELWQLDGGITVYLRNVGRVPYLHIDSNFDYRQPIYDPSKALQIDEVPQELLQQGAIAVNERQEPNFLLSANFNQLRRVVSKQVHYFDHPLFGMVVRINRYNWPEPEVITESENIQR